MPRILVVDDEEDLRELLVEALEAAGHEVEEAEDGLAALERLRARSFHVLLTDLKMPRMDGLELVRAVRAEQPELEVILLTAHGSVPGAVEAMRLGAFDYLLKPVPSLEDLRRVVARAAERRTLMDRAAQRDADGEETRLTWGAPAMARAEALLRRVAQTDTSVLLTGESGTGKEVAARAVHRWSRRAAGPFVVVNCAALSAGLLESELFGHEKGSFTGATARKRGRLELADGGTFFLDEVGELAPELQAKLLRVLQERRFERVGGTRTLEVDVRWVAATNRDLEAAMREGRFREDLYHRLAVFPVALPALRDRREDIPPLAERLLARVAAGLGRPGLALTEDAKRALAAGAWRGNVRELANALERAAILADDDRITSDLLPTPLPGVEAPTAGSGPVPTLAEAEEAAIRQALALFDGHRRRAAEHLGMGLRTLYDKLKRYGID